MASSSRSLRRRTVMGLAALPAAALLLVVNPLQAGAAPAGNNGTVKIDGAEFDTHPDNEPHVGCEFQVDFYGFDKGDYNAKVTFTAQAPTGKGEVLKAGTAFIGGDDNSGGGSQAGLDAEEKYDLTEALSSGDYPEHPQQGFHVKLTVNAPGSQGNDTKHKVFWVKGCTTQPSSNTTAPTTTRVTGNTSGNTETSSNPNTPAKAGVGTNVLGETLTNNPAATPGAAVEGNNVAQPDGTAPASNLAATGAPVGMSLLVAAIALTLGALATHFGKRQPALPQN